MAGTDDSVGRLIAGRYRLLRSLGAGGMGRVWLAHDQELACDVALKELAVPPGMPERELNARIARARGEARHSARLRSNPHVVTVYDSVVDDGLPWIVIEFLPGVRDLDAVVRESGPLSPAETARIGLALLDALAEGHQLGILHRDVKPSNVLLAIDEPQSSHGNGIGRVLLTDYGISLQQDSGEPRLTTASGIIGTPSFLAPERARGSAPTAASDLFSLGATLYFAVEGRGPFEHDSGMATLAALLVEEPAPPQRAGKLAPVLLKLLEKDPAQRLRAGDAASLLVQLTPEAPPPAQQSTVTDRPPTFKLPSIPQPPSHPPAPRPDPQSERSHATQGWRRAWAPGSSPGSPANSPRRQLSRKSRRVIGLAVAAVVLAGVGVWVAVAGFSGSHKPSDSPRTATTGPVQPYGDSVGLSQELHAGECVDATWTGERFKNSPRLTIVDCTKNPDSQVMRTDEPNSPEDARKSGQNRCESDLKETVSTMANARPYALAPTQQGWESGVHTSACLIFDKTVSIGGNVGTFRKLGEAIYISNASVGDCYNNKTTKGQIAQTLAKCDSPHDEQTVGFVETPESTSYQWAVDNGVSICSDKYDSTYKTPTNDLMGYVADKSEWQKGFRYLQCTVKRNDGKKLTSYVVTPV